LGYWNRWNGWRICFGRKSALFILRKKERYVYDFAVADNETFLAGNGGLFVHNTFTMANVIRDINKPTLVIAHNKTLAAQLCNEFRELFRARR